MPWAGWTLIESVAALTWKQSMTPFVTVALTSIICVPVTCVDRVGFFSA